MRTVNLLGALLVVCSVAMAQKAPPLNELGLPDIAPRLPGGMVIFPSGTHFSDPAVQSQFTAMQLYMAMPSPLDYGNRELATMGERAVFFVLVALRRQKLSTAAQALTILDILHKTFARLECISVPEDRDPKAALQLLDLLEERVPDDAVKSRISVERKFLKELPRLILEVPLPKC